MERKGFLSLFKNQKPVLAMIHLKGETSDEVFERAKKEIDIYIENGVDGIILEDYFGNYYDLVRICEYVSQANLSIPFGINCLNFDSLGFELANRYHADFLQIDSVVGHVKPRDEASLEVFLKQERENCNAYLIGGVRFKYQPMLSEKTLAEDLEIATRRCDAVAVTQNATGEETSMEKIEEFKANLGNFPLVVAAGVTKENVKKQLSIADACIVGSYFKDNRKDFGDVCGAHVKELMDIVNELRGELND